ncbi:glycosyltransferase [Alkalibacterium sp. f15]|uniref:glycosyltransferase n=1 Tax=Alkalibacterium sp. f15 TaxID=3414029 RepID=UPI003BF8D28B
MSGSKGGISSFIKNKALALCDENVVFDVISFEEVEEPFKRAIENTGGKIYKVPNPKIKGFKMFKSEVLKVYENQPDKFIIHSHIQGHRMLPFYYLSKKFSPERFIVHAHTDADEVKKKRLQSKLDRIINNTIKIEYASCGIKASEFTFGSKLIKDGRIMHIPNSINVDNFSKTIEKSELDKLRSEILPGISADTLIIGSVARFQRQKNHPFMVEIISELNDKNVDFVWLFIGEGVLKPDIEKLVHEKGLSKHVKFLGRRNDIHKLYKVMDIFALPSFYEGLPTVSIEAQASGTMTYMSDTITKESDLKLDLVKFIPIDDPEKWATKIVDYKPRNVQLDTIKERLVKQKFTNETSAELYNDFLKNKIQSYMI